MEPYKILAVDDDKTLLQLLSNELMNEGYKIALAYDGTEAVDILAKEMFDLIILDIKMPKMNGLDTLKYIKDHYPKTKVIMLTAYADIANALESKRLGADGFIDKPYDLIELLTTINRILTE
jgi:CheY-like chemotaxis protein